MPPIRCFLLEPSHTIRRQLRRYSSDNPCPQMKGSYSYHDAVSDLDTVPEGDRTKEWPQDDPRWPAACGCGYVFAPADARQLFCESLYRKAGTEEVYTLRQAPVGAMYWATWFEKYPNWCGPDGKSLVVMVPGPHPWSVDSFSSNCTKKGDAAHRCWCRHGEVPNITVDKNPEPGWTTCAAGAGSILVPGWHGFLQRGELVTA